MARAGSVGPWLVDPDGPLSRHSRWGPVLAVARRFEAAQERYEVGEDAPDVWRTIALTCTAAFAAELRSHRAVLAPGVSPRRVGGRLVAVQPLERLPGLAIVLATLDPIERGGQPEGFELRLIRRRGAWRVAGMTFV